MQGVQFAEGNRHSVDHQSLMWSSIFGAQAGAMMSAMHAGLHKLNPKFATGKTGAAMTEAATEFFVTLTSLSVLGGDLNSLWTSPINGAFSGGTEKWAHEAGEDLDNHLNGPLNSELPSGSFTEGGLDSEQGTAKSGPVGA